MSVLTSEHCTYYEGISAIQEHQHIMITMPVLPENTVSAFPPGATVFLSSNG